MRSGLQPLGVRDGRISMAITIRHVVWCSATLSLGSFFYMLTMAPMDPDRTPRAAALNAGPTQSNMITLIRRSLSQGHLMAAERQAKELLEFSPDNPDVIFHNALVARAVGKDDLELAYWEELESRTRLAWENQDRYIHDLAYHRAWALMGTGKVAAAQEIFAEIADRLEEARAGEDGIILSSMTLYNLACYRAMAGDTSRAIEHWTSAVSLGYGRNTSDDGWWMADPDLEPLHGIDQFWAAGSALIDDRDQGQRRQARNRRDRGGDTPVNASVKPRSAPAVQNHDLPPFPEVATEDIAELGKEQIEEIQTPDSGEDD